MINPREYHILLAEDDPKLNHEFASQLREKGFHVFPVFDGLQLYQVGSMKSVRENRNLVIVSDTDMPITDGDLVVKRLLEKFPQDYINRIIIGMSDNASYENLWDNLVLKNTFIYKGQNILNPKSDRNLAHRVIDNINFILGNSQFHRNEDGSFKYKV